jgi:hypothetical protein
VRSRTVYNSSCPQPRSDERQPRRHEQSPRLHDVSEHSRTKHSRTSDVNFTVTVQIPETTDNLSTDEEVGVCFELMKILPNTDPPRIWAAIRRPENRVHPMTTAHLLNRCLTELLDENQASQVETISSPTRLMRPGDFMFLAPSSSTYSAPEQEEILAGTSRDGRPKEKPTRRRSPSPKSHKPRIRSRERPKRHHSPESEVSAGPKGKKSKRSSRPCYMSGCSSSIRNMKLHILSKHLPPCFNLEKKMSNNPRCREIHDTLLGVRTMIGVKSESELLQVAIKTNGSHTEI